MSATLFAVLGMAICTEAVLLVASTARLALLIHCMTGIGLWFVFFVINLPFPGLALRCRMNAAA